MVSTKLRVGELLREKRWTTKVLAEKTGMSESYLTHIKNGTRRWNEDALKKLALAFEVHPTDLFAFRKEEFEIKKDINIPNLEEIKNLNKEIDLNIKLAPVVSEIPAEPTKYNNRLMQVASNNQENFVPVLNSQDENIFCLMIQDNSMSPKFLRGDLLIISPLVWTRSGDIVAVEYGDAEDKKREIMQVNYMDDFLVLESVNHKTGPKALVRGKDVFRIIGKVIYRYQEL